VRYNALYKYKIDIDIETDIYLSNLIRFVSANAAISADRVGL